MGLCMREGSWRCFRTNGAKATSRARHLLRLDGFDRFPNVGLCHSSPLGLAAGLAFRMTTSRSPTTTNWVPGSRPSWFRISSGMTTWPFEDILVVDSFKILASRGCSLTGKTSAAGCACQSTCAIQSTCAGASRAQVNGGRRTRESTLLRCLTACAGASGGAYAGNRATRACRTRSCAA